MKDNVVRRKDASQAVISRMEELIEAVGSLSAEDLEYICSKCDDTAVQLVLTATMGLDGCEAVKFAYNHVPESFLSDRRSRVQEIVTEASSKPSLVESCLCEAVATILETRFPRYWNRKPVHSAYLQELKSLTERKGVSYFSFLSPPIHKCINPTCGHLGMTSLSPRHAPVNVAVFTIHGPFAATKVSLRCLSCMMVYNYSMHGNKQGEGEMLYPTERPLVEVTDSKYVERNVYELFCSLRLGRSYFVVYTDSQLAIHCL